MHHWHGFPMRSLRIQPVWLLEGSGPQHPHDHIQPHHPAGGRSQPGESQVEFKELRLGATLHDSDLLSVSYYLFASFLRVGGKFAIVSTLKRIQATMLTPVGVQVLLRA